MNAPLDRRFLLGGLAGAAGVSALAAMTKAGPLNPPAGAIGSTGKPLADVEPRIAINGTNTPGDADSVYKITQAGGYYLTANMLAPTGKHAIKIAASGVTLDLNGFLIAGFGGLGGIIPSSTAVERITIRNGSIASLPFGIQFTDVFDVTVENVRVETVSGYGIRTGERGIVRNCTVKGAGAHGIRAEDVSLVAGCAVSECGLIGIHVHFGSTVADCLAYNNANQGIFSYGALVAGCTARGNTGGIQIQDGLVIGCSAVSNSSSGFYVDQGTIVDCRSQGNFAGISVGQRSTVRGCSAALSSGSGISVIFDQNRIEGNTCTENDKGIFVSQSNGKNVVTGNVCINSRVVNYDIATGNVCLVVAAATADAVSGNSGGVSPGTTSAWANLAL